MFRTIRKNNRKGQNTAEYALMISLVVAGAIAMQTYTQRALQARIRGAATNYAITRLTEEGAQTQLFRTGQYEPYYLNSSYTVTRNSVEQTVFGKRTIGSVTQNDWRYYNARTNEVRNALGFKEQKAKSGLVETGL